MGLFDKYLNLFKSSGESPVNWAELHNPEEVDVLIDKSDMRPQLIYKHSERCGTCYFAQNELEYVWDEICEMADPSKIDVIRQRRVSDYVSDILQVRHESPQAILLYKKKVVWEASHGAVKGDTVLEALSGL